MGLNATLPLMPRAVCPDCLRPARVCLCRHMAEVCVENRTEVIILQHPRERLHSLGTAPIAERGLSRVRLEVADFDSRGEPFRRLEVPAGAVLLYPRPLSRNLADLPEEERPSALVVLDGTWGNAKRLLKTNKPWLDGLPAVHLKPVEAERYRIRGQPTTHARSTIEAIVAALKILEPETSGLESLISVFHAVIDAQVSIIRSENAGCRRPLKKIARRSKAL